ncbi:MAG TPA: glycosyltransferase [Gemmatimonadales bacterium]|nr:glycosyltransferase [Gemmatimonadales bacterium]
MSIERTVLFIAEFDDVSHAYSAQCQRALERLGAKVTAFDLAARPSLLQRFRAGDLVHRLERVVDETDPELVLVIGGDALDEALVDRLRARVRARWINWLPHDLRSISSAISLARPYDHLYATGTDIAAEIGERLGRTVDVLAFAADPSVYRPIRTKDQYRANVVFAGSATPRRERLLGELVEFGLAVWGPGWRKTGLRDYCRGEAPSTTAYVKAYAGATVAINIHHCAAENSPHDASCNQRLFELAAMGAAQVVDERGDLPRYFEAGNEVVVFQDGGDLRNRVRDLIENPGEAERLGQAARLRALQEHTYMHRTRQLLLDQPRGPGYDRRATDRG